MIFVKTKTQASVLFWFVCLVCILFLSISIKGIFEDLDAVGWDFLVYYNTSIAFAKGINPYSMSETVQEIGFSFLPYKYSPISLYLFKVFNLWSYYDSLQIYMVLKTFIWFLTISIWTIYVFQDYKLKTFLILITTFGFNKAALLDFNAGNISIFEVFAITIAVIFLLRNNIIIYCLIIAFLALFKVQIIALIFISLINFERKRVYITISFLFICTILFLLYYYCEPLITQAYIDQIYNSMQDKGSPSPNFGVLLLINQFVNPFLNKIIDFKYWNYIIYFCWINLIALLTFLVFKKTKTKVTNMILITYSIFAYALIIPRFQDYTFTFLFVPALYVIHYCFSNYVVKSLVCLVICTGFLGYYQPVIVVLGLFAMYLLFFYRISTGKILLPVENISQGKVNRKKIVIFYVISIILFLTLIIYFGRLNSSSTLEEFETLVKEKIACSVPDQMEIGKNYKATVSSTKALNDSILLNTLEKTYYGIETINLSSRMKMILIDPTNKNFKITALNTEEQLVDDSANTIWNWNVFPIKEGVNELVLRATLKILNKPGENYKDIIVLETAINVDNSVWLTIKQFISDYWQWFTLVFLIPMIIWSYRKISERKKKNDKI